MLHDDGKDLFKKLTLTSVVQSEYGAAVTTDNYVMLGLGQNW